VLVNEIHTEHDLSRRPILDYWTEHEVESTRTK
jgi:hypothetical protein